MKLPGDEAIEGAVPDPPPLIDTRGLLNNGERVGEYRIVQPIANGGFGAVYRAQHVVDEREVALKVLHQSRFNHENMERFRREVQALRTLDHPNVVKLFDVGEHTDDRPFLVMEYLRGMSLERFLADHGRMSLSKALSILNPVCQALAVAHACNIVHRDVKASNIFLHNWDAERKRVVLLDFGLVKLTGELSNDVTSSRHRIGTPSAMAPEQIAGGTADARTDIYGVGNLAFLMLTGKLPFDSSSPVLIQQMHLHARVPNPCTLAPMEPAIGAAIMRAMEKPPEHRFQTILQFRDALGTTDSLTSSASSFAKKAVPALAAHLEVLVDKEDLVDGGDDVLDDLEHVLTLGARFFVHSSFETVLESGVSALFLQLSAATVAGLADGLHKLQQELDNRAHKDPRLRWQLCLHAAAKGWRDGRWSNDLTDIASWVPKQLEGIVITEAARDQLGLVNQSVPIGSDGLYRLARNQS